MLRISSRMQFLSFVIWTMAIVKCAKSQTGLMWNKRLKSFEPIPSLFTYEDERRKIIRDSRQQETHNFNGQPLNVTYYEDAGFFEYRDNDTKVAGICGDIWTVLSKFLNFTLVFSKNKTPNMGSLYKNGTYSGILEYARLNQTDVVPKMTVYITRIRAVEFSPVFWINRQRIFAYGKWKGNRTWMFTLLSMDVWASIFSFITIVSLASLVTQRILIRHRGRMIEHESFFDHFFYSFGTMCNQSMSWSDKTGSGSNMLNFTMDIFAILTITAYNSHLIGSMTKESFEAPFNDLETLFNNTNFHIVILEGSSSHVTFTSSFSEPIFGRINRSNRLTIVKNLDDLYEKVCKYSEKYVMFDSEDSVAVRGKRQCSVIPVGAGYYQTPIASGISRGVKYRKSLKIGIMKLREYGVLNAIRKRYRASTVRERVIRHPENLAIGIDHVSIIIGILCLGIVLSIIICVAEIIIFNSKKKT